MAAALACVVALVLLGISVGRGLIGFLNSAGSGGEPDPMFAQPAEHFTRPPELAEETPAQENAPDDPSRAWVYEEKTPVDQTAEELAAQLDDPGA